MKNKTHDEASGDTIQQPRPAHLREEQEPYPDDEHSSDDQREATELRSFGSGESDLAPISHVLSPPKPRVHAWYDPVQKFWRHNVRISVPHDDCRDHLANERTFLAFIRTSVIFSMLGVFIAQLSRLEHQPNPSDVFGYYILSRPLAMICHGAALCVTVLGAIRFWRQQSAMAIGRVHAGGWEMITVGLLTFAILLVMFAVHLGISIYKANHG